MKAEADREVPDVIEDLAPAGPWSMSKIDPAAELAAFESAAQLLSKLVPASIKATRPQDWVKMGDKVYLQATGVERLAPLWGLVFGESTVTREEYEGGEFGYVVRGPVGSRRTGVFYKVVEGGRSSSDPFFDSFDEDKPKGFYELSPAEKADWRAKHRVPPDPLDVRKAAVTNWMVRGASMLCGMRNLTPADLEQGGIRGVSEVQYRSGGKGGDAAPADLKAKRTALWNDVLKRAGGEVEVARSLLKEITAYPAYKNKKTNKDVPAFAGNTDPDTINSEVAVRIAAEKLAKHPVFGDDAEGREPGEEG